MRCWLDEVRCGEVKCGEVRKVLSGVGETR